MKWEENFNLTVVESKLTKYSDSSASCNKIYEKFFCKYFA